MTTKNIGIGTLLLAGLVLFWAEPALAVQQHGGAEGLIAHQIGHLLFFSGIAYLLTQISLSGFIEPGWFEFKGFLWVIIGWNILTFTGHWMRETADPAGFSRVNGRIVSYSINSLTDAYFYLTRLDHLLLVPAFVFLFLALRKWGEQR